MKKLFSKITEYVLSLCERTGYAVFDFVQRCVFAVSKPVGAVKRECKMIARRVRVNVRLMFHLLKKYGAKLMFSRLNGKKSIALRIANIAAPVVSIVLVMVFAASFNNLTMAYEVKCEGETIGYVDDKSVVDEASDIVKSQVSGDKQIQTQPQVQVTLVNQNEINSANELSEKIIQNSGELSEGYGLYIDDKLALVVKEKSIAEKAIEQYKDKMVAATKANGVEIIEKYELKKGLYCDVQMLDSEKLAQKLESGILTVQTIKIEHRTEVLKYDTITAKDNTKYEGYERVEVEGENGEMLQTLQTTFINGKKTGSLIVRSDIVKSAINEQIIVGTRKKTVKNVATPSKKFFWPVSYKQCYISQYFGNEGHTGIDFAASIGSNVYASADGVVCEVTYSDKSYGNRVKINHGNGVITLYAHLSTIDVKEGDEVTAGQVIAAVGSTGNSTGPHTHYEVRVNGVQVDPAPYLGYSK